MDLDLSISCMTASASHLLMNALISLKAHTNADWRTACSPSCPSISSIDPSGSGIHTSGIGVREDSRFRFLVLNWMADFVAVKMAVTAFRDGCGAVQNELVSVIRIFLQPVSGK